MSNTTSASAETAAWGLREHRGTAALLTLLGALAVAAALPAAAYGGGWAPSLRLPWPVEAVARSTEFARSNIASRTPARRTASHFTVKEQIGGIEWVCP